jgi:hypothetical protein
MINYNSLGGSVKYKINDMLSAPSAQRNIFTISDIFNKLPEGVKISMIIHIKGMLLEEIRVIEETYENIIPQSNAKQSSENGVSFCKITRRDLCL